MSLDLHTFISQLTFVWLLNLAFLAATPSQIELQQLIFSLAFRHLHVDLAAYLYSAHFLSTCYIKPHPEYLGNQIGAIKFLEKRWVRPGVLPHSDSCSRDYTIIANL